MNSHKKEEDSKVVSKPQKRVRFFPVIYVNLVPFYTEYFTISEIWYTKNDCEVFQKYYIQDLMSLMERHNIDIRLAKRILNRACIEYNETDYL